MEPKQQTVTSNKYPAVKSSMLKAGKKTYFFDVKEAANKKRYLKITESSFEKDSDKRKYSSFVLFPEQVPDFQQRIAELTGDLQVVA